MEAETSSQVSLEMRDMSVSTVSSMSGDSPPPPYSSSSDSTSLEADHQMIEDSFSATGSSASHSDDVSPYAYFGGLDDGGYDYPSVVPSEIRKVILEKDTRGFGLTVAGGADSQYGILPVFVTSVQPDGVAADTGEVMLGDRIVSVNGKEMEGKTHREVVIAIKEAGRRVTLELTEGPENIMNYLAFD